MVSITLPTIEETTLTINLQDRSVVLDMFEYELLKDRVIDKLRELNLLGDTKAFMDIFCKEMETEYGLKMSMLAASELLSFADDYYVEVKKKYFERLGSLSSTPSIPVPSSEESPSVPENSNS